MDPLRGSRLSAPEASNGRGKELGSEVRELEMGQRDPGAGQRFVRATLRTLSTNVSGALRDRSALQRPTSPVEDQENQADSRRFL